MNVCSACGLDFANEHSFDEHRVGDYPQKGPSEFRDRIGEKRVESVRNEYGRLSFVRYGGLETEPWTAAKGRRCRDEDELTALGFKRDRHGRWVAPTSPPREHVLARVEFD